MAVAWFALFAGVLATYRVSFMVVSEDGPAYVFSRIRKRIHDQTIDTKHQWIYEGATCVLCASFWLSWMTAALLYLAGVTTVPLWLMALAIAGGCFLIHKLLYG